MLLLPKCPLTIASVLEEKRRLTIKGIGSLEWEHVRGRECVDPGLGAINAMIVRMHHISFCLSIY